MLSSRVVYRAFRISSIQSLAISILVSATLVQGVLYNSSSAYAQESFTLTHLGSTQTQIALTWGRVTGATEYVVYRSTSPDFQSSQARYRLSGAITSYGDTGFDPSFSGRFVAYSEAQLGLQFDTDYYYKIEAKMTGAASAWSNVIQARKDRLPVRGVSGDLWADIVLGQRSFSEYSWSTVRSNVTDLPGGVAIHRRGSVALDRIYVVDANHNRILGYNTGNISPTSTPTIILGQPDTASTTCNGESTRLSYPQKPSATASSLCLSRDGNLSPGETVILLNLAVDSEGNLYMPDPYNHRILKYNRPFETDAVADEVWGQGGSFQTREPNKGGVSASSLHLSDFASVDVDSQGNLWVTDFFNRRVLRFPKKNGAIQKTADVVLGQDDFTRVAPVPTGSPLNRLFGPVSVRVSPSGDVYVGDRDLGRRARVLRYNAGAIASAIQAGRATVSASQIVLSSLPDWSQDPDFTPTGMALDVQRGGLWIQSTWAERNYFYSFSQDAITKVVVGANNARGVEVDSVGNLYSISAEGHDGLSRFAANAVSASSVQAPLRWDSREVLITNISQELARSQHDLDAMTGLVGITVAGPQLVMSDVRGLFFWNDYRTLQNSKPADGFWRTSESLWHMGPPRLDSSTQLWISGVPMNSAVSCGSNSDRCLYQVQMPLSADSPILKTISISAMETKEGVPLYATYQDMARFSLESDGDSAWLGTMNHGAVRLTNLRRMKDRARGPYVDIILGVPTTNAVTSCPTMSDSTICYAHDTNVDGLGNLWVVDHNRGMDGGGTRLLRFDQATLPRNPVQTQFAIPASAVYGTHQSFTSIEDVDAGGQPLRTPSLLGPYQMAFAQNPYGGNPFTLVNLYGDQTILPQLTLGDYMGFGGDQTFDKEGNLYVGDWNWNRILVFKQPFAKVQGLSQFPPAQSPPTDQAPQTLSLRVTKSRKNTVRISSRASYKVSECTVDIKASSQESDVLTNGLNITSYLASVGSYQKSARMPFGVKRDNSRSSNIFFAAINSCSNGVILETSPVQRLSPSRGRALSRRLTKTAWIRRLRQRL